MNGVLSPASSVAGHAARGQVVRGQCSAKGCQRKVELDPVVLVRAGLGQLDIAMLQRLWRCQRIDGSGCFLSFHAEPALKPLRLEHLEGRAHVRLRIRCRQEACRFFRVWRVEQVAASLTRRGLGDARTPVDAVPALLKSPCPLCRRTSWAVEVLWADTESAGWKAGGEGVFG